MNDSNTSRTLIIRIKEQNDDLAWEQFTTTYTPFISSLIKQFGINKEDTDELTQDVLVKVWKALPNFLYERERCKFRAWLSRICKNTALNFLNSKTNKQAQQTVSNTEDLLSLTSTNSPLEASVEKEWKLFIANQAWSSVRQQFSDLHLNIYSFMMEGNTAADTAKKFDIKENTAFIYRKSVQEAMTHSIKRLQHELDC